MIRIEALSKTYGGSVALSQIDLVVGRGEILGLSGTNGAGRTTLLNILATLVRPTSGRVEIDGIDALKHPFKVRPRVGYLAQSPGFYEELTAREMLDEARRHAE